MAFDQDAKKIVQLSDSERLAALHLTGLLDTPPEQAFDRFTTLAHQIVGKPIVLLSLVDGDRQFFKSQVGLPEPVATERQTPLSHSLCQHVVTRQAPLLISDARCDPLVKDNLAVVELGVVAYAGVPLRTSDGQVIGSFCSIDTEPHEWTSSEVDVLTGLADMVMREVALRQLAQELHLRNQALHQAEVQRNDLVTMTVHDLRTPLTSLLSGLQTLETFLELEETPRQIMDITVRGARSLAEMIDQILDVSRAEAGQLQLSYKPVPAPSIITSALEQVQYFSQKRSLRVLFEVDPAVPVLLLDESKIKRVLVNLLGNAVQHSRDNGEVRINVAMTPNGASSLWSVADTGVGIDPEDLETIFDKFRQGKTEAKVGSSSGLGLTFCRMVVENHGGRIWVQSQKGEGSVFSFSIPHRTI